MSKDVLAAAEAIHALRWKEPGPDYPRPVPTGVVWLGDWASEYLPTLIAELKAAQAEVERLRVALRRSECRHLGGIESWDSLPPTLICCDCGADVSPEPRP